MDMDECSVRANAFDALVGVRSFSGEDAYRVLRSLRGTMVHGPRLWPFLGVPQLWQIGFFLALLLGVTGGDDTAA